MNAVLGIDPGLSGAIAVLFDNGEVRFIDIGGEPAMAVATLRELGKQHTLRGAVIEKAGVMPNQGSASGFRFGETAGMLKGACMALGIPLLAEPRPTEWKRLVGIPMNPPKKATDATGEEKAACRRAMARYKRDMKVVSRERAVELFPYLSDELRRAKDGDRAEALLLAYLANQVIRGGVSHDSDKGN